MLMQALTPVVQDRVQADNEESGTPLGAPMPSRPKGEFVEKKVPQAFLLVRMFETDIGGVVKHTSPWNLCHSLEVEMKWRRAFC